MRCGTIKQKKQSKIMKWLYLVCVLALVLVIIIITYGSGEILPSLKDIFASRPNRNQTQEESTTDNTVKKKIEAFYFDVGHGECALYVCGGDTMLVDTGEKDYSGRIVGYLESLGIKKINYLVASSFQSDCIGGMSTVIQKFDIGSVIFPEKMIMDAANPLILATLSALNAKQITPMVADLTAGTEFRLGNAYVEILSILDDEDDDSEKTINLHISLDDMSFLHLANCEDETLESLMEIYPDMYASVLKIPNHGAYSDALGDFVGYCLPSAAVIDVSRLYQSVPAEKTIRLLEKTDVKYYRTDERGSIDFVSDGKTFTVKTDK